MYRRVMISTAMQKSDAIHFTEAEAARELGVTVEEFRELIRIHIMREGEEVLPSRKAVFQSSDLLLLRLLTGRTSAATIPG